MIGEFNVFKESHRTWPARNGKPAGEFFGLLLTDHTVPAKYALEELYEYRLTEDERVKYWGKIEKKNLKIAVTAIAVVDNRKPLLRGEILSVAEK